MAVNALNNDSRFWKYVTKTSTCWLWTGGCRNGYGMFNYFDATKNRPRTIGAHKWLWEQFYGKVPEQLQLDHLCRVRNCVNPAHLEPVTPQTNTLRSTAPSATNALKTHCKHGHLFTPENTYQQKPNSNNPGRGCQTCRNMRWRKEEKTR